MIQAASNATFDATAATLDRYSEPQKTYTLRIRKCQKTILPGDKVTVHYHGDIQVEDNSGQVHYAYEEIDGDFWVIEAYENYGADGFTVELRKSAISTATAKMSRRSSSAGWSRSPFRDCGAAQLQRARPRPLRQRH